MKAAYEMYILVIFSYKMRDEFFQKQTSDIRENYWNSLGKNDQKRVGNLNVEIISFIHVTLTISH
jgi:hypothetical protein